MKMSGPLGNTKALSLPPYKLEGGEEERMESGVLFVTLNTDTAVDASCV